jgi:hypothetical protein
LIDLNDIAMGVLLVEMVHDLLQQFIRPRSHLCPIRVSVSHFHRLSLLFHPAG